MLATLGGILALLPLGGAGDSTVGAELSRPANAFLGGALVAAAGPGAGHQR